jgi:hypothetical protein
MRRSSSSATSTPPARRDWAGVRALLAADVAWHEAGDEDYSGDHRGNDEVTALLQRLVEVTEGSFTLEPLDFIAPAEHVATNARWSAERSGKRVESNDLAVYRIAADKIAGAWFFPDGFDPEALAEVFSFGERWRAPSQRGSPSSAWRFHRRWGAAAGGRVPSPGGAEATRQR